MTFKILACLLAVSTLASGQSGVLREVWTQVDGGTINALVTSPNYPEAPLFSTLQTEFRSATNWGDRYGVRMRALLTAPATGDYTFWISGDDTCELYLSTTENPANKVRIARAPAWTALETWTTYPEQRSAPVSLTAGSRYYIEALMKESTGGDSLSVAWAAAPSTTPVVLAGSALTPFLATGAAPTGVVVQAGREITQYSPNLTVQLSAQALHMANTSRSPTFVWSQVSGAAAVIKTPSDGNTTVDLPAAGTYVFRVTATVNGGTGTDDVTVKVLPKLAPDAGTALAEYWFGVSGATIAALTGSVDYPNFPHAHRVVTSLSAALDQGDLFGSRTRGFILAPATGSYRFFVAGDSTAEFWLSPDATAANVQRRCQVTTAVTAENYFGRDEQASSVIALEAGKRYAFELRHKDDSGGDHCSVLWQQPGSDYVTEVSTEFIAPPADAAAVKAATSPFDQNSDFILNAGRDQVLYRPQMNTALSAYESRRYSGSDTPTRAWTKVSGPGTVTFSDSGLAQTNVVFATTGTYLLRYSFEPGLVLRNEVTHLSKNSTRINSVLQDASSRTITDKTWHVLESDEQSTTFEYLVEAVDLSQQFGSNEEIRYNTKEPSEQVPVQFAVPVVEVAREDQRLGFLHHRRQVGADALELLHPMVMEQIDVGVEEVQRRALHVHHRVEETAHLLRMQREIEVVPFFYRPLREDGVAVVALGIDGILAVGVVVPDGVGEILELRLRGPLLH
jgi:hypothetical protein